MPYFLPKIHENSRFESFETEVELKTANQMEKWELTSVVAHEVNWLGDRIVSCLTVPAGLLK